MENEAVLEAIKDSIRGNPKDFVAYADLTDMLKGWAKESEEAYGRTDEVLFIQNVGMRLAVQEERYEDAEMLRKLIYRTLVFSAPKKFDHFLQALEYNRNPKDRFYLPRRDVLKGHVDALQDLEDRKLDELFLSQPPRTGKTSLVMFFLAWIFGRDPEHSNLYSSVSDDLTKTFYNRMLEVLMDTTTYRYADIFPEAVLVAKNGDKETIDIGRVKGYPTFTARSLYGSLNGSCDAYNYLVSDDVLSGIEEARNPERLKTAQTTVNNNLLSRAKETCRILWIGTRWSLQDPIGNRIRALENDPAFQDVRYKCINIPALDDNDESNFEYKYGVGFSTAFYRRKRATFEQDNDIASWNAQYMGLPIEREGTVFTPDTMRYYNGELPDADPVSVWAVCDPAFGGGDFVSCPIIFTYNKMDNYVADVVYNNGDKSVTIPLLARKLMKHNVSAIDIEVSKTSRSYADALSQELEKIGYHCTVTTHIAPQNRGGKEMRILDKAPDIRRYFIFRDTAHRKKDYVQFMANIFSFKIEGRNLHDDAPDSMGMAAERLFKRGAAKIEIVSRPF